MRDRAALKWGVVVTYVNSDGPGYRILTPTELRYRINVWTGEIIIPKRKRKNEQSSKNNKKSCSNERQRAARAHIARTKKVGTNESKSANY